MEVLYLRSSNGYSDGVGDSDGDGDGDGDANDKGNEDSGERASEGGGKDIQRGAGQSRELTSVCFKVRFVRRR